MLVRRIRPGPGAAGSGGWRRWLYRNKPGWPHLRKSGTGLPDRNKDVIDLAHAGQGDFAAEVFCIAHSAVAGDDAVAGITGLADVARRLLADIPFYQFPVPRIDHAAETVMDVVSQFFIRNAAKKADDIVTGIEQRFSFIGFINKDSPGQALGDAGRQSGLVLPVHWMFHASISCRNIFYISYIPSVYFCIYFYFIILQA